jgi:hypothetical protein
MRKFLIWLLISFSFIVGFHISFAGSWEQSPDGIINDLKSTVQDTKLNNTIPWQWQWINESLGGIKKWSGWYIQWLWYIWLSVALFLIIYNWILILANFGEEDKLSKAKKRFVSLIIWVVLLTSAIVVIRVVVGLVWTIFN